MVSLQEIKAFATQAGDRLIDDIIRLRAAQSNQDEGAFRRECQKLSEDARRYHDFAENATENLNLDLIQRGRDGVEKDTMSEPQKPYLEEAQKKLSDWPVEMMTEDLLRALKNLTLEERFDKPIQKASVTELRRAFDKAVKDAKKSLSEVKRYDIRALNDDLHTVISDLESVRDGQEQKGVNAGFTAFLAAAMIHLTVGAHAGVLSGIGIEGDETYVLVLSVIFATMYIHTVSASMAQALQNNSTKKELQALKSHRDQVRETSALVKSLFERVERTAS